MVSENLYPGTLPTESQTAYDITSRSTVTPPTFLQRNRRFQNQLPAVSPKIRCPLPPRRHRFEDIFFMASFLVSSSHCMKRSLEKIAGSGGRYHIISLTFHHSHLHLAPPTPPPFTSSVSVFHHRRRNAPRGRARSMPGSWRTTKKKKKLPTILNCFWRRGGA